MLSCRTHTHAYSGAKRKVIVFENRKGIPSNPKGKSELSKRKKLIKAPKRGFPNFKKTKGNKEKARCANQKVKS